MNDILSAASLLFAISGILYGFWYPEISQVLDLKIEGYRSDNISKLSRVKVARNKTIFLSAASIIFILIFSPVVIKIINSSFKNILTTGCTAYKSYDPVQASLVFVLSCSLAIVSHLILLCKKLNKKLKTKLKD
jgi:hypothetical protein